MKKTKKLFFLKNSLEDRAWIFRHAGFLRQRQTKAVIREAGWIWANDAVFHASIIKAHQFATKIHSRY